MIKVLANVITEGDVDISLSVVDGTKLQVSTKDGASLVLDPSNVYEKPDVAVGYIDIDGNIKLLWDSERFNTRDAASSAVERKFIPSIATQAFVVGFAGDDILFTSSAPLKCETAGFEVVQFDNGDAELKVPRVLLANHSPSISALVTRNKAKRALLAHVKAEDSLSALEKQVDLLTKLVSGLIASQSAYAAPDWYASFISAIDQADSTKFITKEAAVAEVKGLKDQIRALQEKYFTDR